MSNLITFAFVALGFALLSLRPLTADTRSIRDYRDRARRAGWGRFLFGTLKVALVASLLVLNDACRLSLNILKGVRAVLGPLATALSQPGQPAIGGAA